MKFPSIMLAAAAVLAAPAASLGPATLSAGAARLHTGSFVILGQPLVVPAGTGVGVRPGLLPVLLAPEGPHPELRLGALAGWDAGGFRLSFSAVPGREYVLWSTTNLVEWTPRQTFRAATTLMLVTDPADDGPPWRFYRLELRPR